jgi:putative flippase GtrA
VPIKGEEMNFIKRIIKIFLQREVFMYVLFGVLTTLVNLIVFYVSTKIGLSTAISTTVAFILAVLFAYVTNKKWVFQSHEKTTKGILLEIWRFFAVRIGTFIIDLTIMIIFVDILHFDSLICKIIDNVIVVILNYIASKIIVFKKEK